MTHLRSLRRSPSSVRLAAVVAGLSLFSAACSSGGAHRSTQAASTAGSNSSSSDQKTAKNEAAERRTPLSAFFTEGQGGEPTPADREAAANDFNHQEQLIAECMQDQGFEYIPQDYNQGVQAKVKNQEAFDLPPDAYAERWGYGISTVDRSQFKAETPDDPNSAIADGLSESARAAYDTALYGGLPASRVGSSADAPVPDGCRTKAMKDVHGEDFANQDKSAPSEFDAINDEMGALWDQVANDPRVVEAQKAWADCMADAGHPEVTDPDDAPQKVMERFTALYGVDASHFKEVQAGMKAAPQQPDPAALTEVQNYELALAVADRHCKKGYDDVVFEVQSDVENRFIDEHRAELERYRDSIGLQGGGSAARSRIAAIAGGGRG